MRKIIFTALIVTCASLTSIFSQIPYFSSSQGKGKVYTYLSSKFHPGINHQQMYLTTQWGVLDQFDLVTDASIGTGWSNQGFGVRYNFYKSDHFGIGGQFMSNFNINNNYKYDYSWTALYMGGTVVGNLMYASNTWYTFYRNNSWAASQWTYLGYNVGKVTPMAGLITDFDSIGVSNSVAIGTYIEVFKNSYLYLWSSNLFNNDKDIKLVIGMDYKF